MSLVVWLPLNGNSENQGTKQYTETINTLEYTSNGKTTNKCMNLGRLQYDKNPLGMVGSICFWIYPKSTDEGGNGKAQPIFGNDNASNSSRKWALYLYSSQPSVTPHNTSLHSWGCQKDGNSNPNGDFTLNGVLKESAWNHVCVAHDLDYEYVYINGVLKNKTEWDSNGTFTFDVGTPIIYGDYNNYESNYRLNDFRIYNHCLTQSEVSEIAKGLMLHYSFENPYAEGTINIPHSLIVHDDNHIGEATLGSDSTGNYIIKNGMTTWSGIGIEGTLVKPGRYYTWSMEVMPTKNIEYVIDNSVTCSNPSHSGNDTFHFDIIRGHSHTNHKIDGSDTLPKGKLEAYKWTRVYSTIKIKKDCSNPIIFHTFCPYIPSGSTEVKVYYKNSQLEEKPYDTPYTSSDREAGLIRDNSGMGNDGTQVYQRIELPLTPKTQTTCSTLTKYGGVTNTYNSTNKTYTLNNFVNTDNAVCLLATMKYNNLYHYVDSVMSYEFDITLKDIVTVSGTTPHVRIQGPTIFKDDTFRWDSNPVSSTFFTPRLNNLKNGTYHIYIEKTIENVASNIDYYELGMRFDGIKSGTFTVSNLHAYYGSLDTSTLSLVSDSPVGTHSAYFNGKNFIKIPDISLPLGDLTVSFWGKYNTNNIAPWGRFINLSKSTENSERLIVATANNNLNFHYYGTDTNNDPSGTSIVTPLNKEGWHLYTLVINNSSTSKMSLYIDGEFETDTTINTKHTGVLMKENYIGKSSYAVDSNLCGYIDDVRLYATALSDEDIKALYNVKTKIDNKSNLYCNQLIETKQENLASDLSKITDFGALGCNCNINYDTNNRILTFTLTSNSKNSYVGPYILNKYYGGQLITNKTYRYSIYVKFSKSGTWKVGEERIINSLSSPFKNGQEYEAGKWYKIENEGVATAAQVNFIFYYCSGLLEVGDKIEIRDFQMYRLYDDENYNPGPNIKGQYKTFEIDETGLDEYTNYPTINKYNATWLQIFHHDTNGNTVWFTNEAEALHCNTEYKYSILDQLEGFRGSDGKFEFLLEYPQDLPNQYNRWKQTDNPATTLEANNSTYGTSANGYEAIHVDWISKGWGGLLKSKNVNNDARTFIDGSANHDNWYYSIGCYNNAIDWKDKMPGPDGNTGMKEVNLYVRLDEKYMGATIVDKYGAEWLEVFYHDNNNCKVFFDSQTEALHTNSQYKFSILDQLEKFRGNDGKFEFLLEYPTDIPSKYNRWKQTDNPVKVLANNTYASGYEAIHVDWSGNNWGGLLRDTNSNFTLLRGSIVNTNNWFFAIGAIKAWSSLYNGVPGPYPDASSYSNPNGIVHDIHLYVRIDNLPNKNEIFRQYKRQTKTKEIIEI